MLCDPIAVVGCKTMVIAKRRRPTHLQLTFRANSRSVAAEDLSIVYMCVVVFLSAGVGEFILSIDCTMVNW